MPEFNKLEVDKIPIVCNMVLGRYYSLKELFPLTFGELEELVELKILEKRFVPPKRPYYTWKHIRYVRRK